MIRRQPLTAGTTAQQGFTPDGDGAIVIAGVQRAYGRTIALREVNLVIRCGVITGLVGRNGAGKTTLMRLIAGHELPSLGAIRISGQDPYENSRVITGMTYLRDDTSYLEHKARDVLAIARELVPTWDQNYSERLIRLFEIPTKRKLRKLSRGQRSALRLVLGLASGTDIVLFDEPTDGLDPVARQLFYDELLANYAATGRTMVLSTHLADEASSVIEDLVVLHRGDVVYSGAADAAAGFATEVSGPSDAVRRFVEEYGGTVLGSIGAITRAVVTGLSPHTVRQMPAASTLQARGLGLQEMLLAAAAADLPLGATTSAGTIREEGQ